MAAVSKSPAPVIERRHQVQERTGLTRTAIYKGMADGTFPKAIRLTDRSVGWLESEITDWINQRVAASRNQKAAA
ncbi:CP4-57 prophage; transcriptional acitvator of a P4-like cryptic prophage [Candidatus Competibacter denitrificans Run_A_D11]|uniref:CP4-57 prophage transcriptional acitvator of a P4-like cryptic prophage n=1 Tax=Candidatus Competibacter denitrificans Run_A_D11 TaxID=1400863 RepID=W6M236_9GAMM|nr:AlpA family phage regulatory protein [Candidatus Competibacter denitrificans]CDI01526.1 CP4-57 prophage; transcriptional acitvator of a P4-like cryptic prophage [Candidatus Competibacter denitrificans Run_A_D11]HAS86880.1 AlpA family phage regulatory protein [Candidatus Competibacteraceae bacterium]HRC68582.1 AlpA family phage regulatory protein [Candidatus Competibacter denitrificans]